MMGCSGVSSIFFLFPDCLMRLRRFPSGLGRVRSLDLRLHIMDVDSAVMAAVGAPDQHRDEVRSEGHQQNRWNGDQEYGGPGPSLACSTGGASDGRIELGVWLISASA